MNIELQSNAAAVAASLQRFPREMAIAIAGAMDLQNQLTIGHSQLRYLTGPRPAKLGVVTNRLRGSLRAARARVSGNEIRSAIGSNVAYAGAHERGVDKQVQVRAHIRESADRDTYEQTVTARTFRQFDPQTGRIKNVKAKVRERAVGDLAQFKGRNFKKVASGIVTVRAHPRHMKMPARPFIMPALQDRANNYSVAVSDAVVDAWNGGLSGGKN